MTVFSGREGPEGTFCVTARGHATGSERVCAAVSSLVYALAGYLVNAEEDGEAKVERLRMERGYFQAEFSGGAGAKAAYEMAYIGLLQLSRAHPNLVEKEKDPP